ncbi:hypothetical protein D7S86_01050 [Pararobbsia silviterrae]|uniref:Uncharacterized protein n=1 Tax=Pararobbsia silviterrae TaxID=1792498 RepID=A0A494YCW9_9BURK|nr:hypothetical protein D7S86_01050 [Pararobbsia silviterrae]
MQAGIISGGFALVWANLIQLQYDPTGDTTEFGPVPAWRVEARNIGLAAESPLRDGHCKAG